jgi:hypothetical protein
MAGKAVPIIVARTTQDSSPAFRRYQEKAAQTFIEGTPVFRDTNGGVAEWSGVVATSKVAGIAIEPAANLTTLGTAKTLTFGAVPNQSAARNIPRGAPLNDGSIGVQLADDTTEFQGVTDSAVAALETDVGEPYGLTKDTNNYWLIDKGKTDSIVITGVYPGDADRLGGRLFFRFLSAAAQMGGA